MNAQVLVKFQNQIESILRPIFSLASEKTRTLSRKAKAARVLATLSSDNVKVVLQALETLFNEKGAINDAKISEIAAMEKRQRKELEDLTERHSKESSDLRSKHGKLIDVVVKKIDKNIEKLRLLGAQLSDVSWRREEIISWRADMMLKGHFDNYVPLWYALGKPVPTDIDSAPMINRMRTLTLTSFKESEVSKEAQESVKDFYTPIIEASEALKESMVMAWTAEDAEALRTSIRDINQKKRVLVKMCADIDQAASVATDCPTSK